MQIQAITFPRSGHHFLVNTIANYASKLYKIEAQFKRHPNLRLQPNDAAYIKVGPFSYCEYYNCCIQTPCPHNVTIQKNHDFKFKIPIDLNSKYIVQFRNPVYSLTSLSKLNEINPKDLHDFFIVESNEWNKWIEKWVLPRYKNILYVSYENLISNTNEVLSKVLEYIGLPIDKTLLNYTSNPRVSVGDYDVRDIVRITSSTYNKIIKFLSLGGVKPLQSKGLFAL